MMRKIYILDFDGTLGDSRGLILRTMMDTFNALGIDRPTEEACVNTIGLPLADCFVVVGVILGAVYYLWFYEKYDARKKDDATDADGDK